MSTNGEDQSVFPLISALDSLEKLVRRGGLEPPRAFAQRIFLPSTTFAAAFGVCGLDYPFTLSRIGSGNLGAARLVSTPSRFRAWLGIAISQVSPNLSSSASAVSRQSTQSLFKSVASTRFRHARITVSYYSFPTNINQENSITKENHQSS